MKIALILAAVAVTANLLFIWYTKRRGNKSKADGSSNHKDASYSDSRGFLNTPEVKQLKQLAAAELRITVEELNRLPVEEIMRLAEERGLI